MTPTRRVKPRLRDPIILATIILLAGFMRIYRIDAVPPGMHFDEAFNIFDILRLLQGQFSIFFPANFGREPLYFYLSMVGGALFGAESLTLRLTSAIIGTATVGMTYVLARAVFRSFRVGAFTALFMAISVWHIYYSRLGLRVILSVLLVVLTLWSFWRALAAVEAEAGRAREGSYFALAGLFASLTVYTYTAGRLLPVILGVMTLYAMLTARARAGLYWRGIVITGIVALLVFLPLGAYFVVNPKDFFEHGSNLSVWDPRVNQGNLIGTIWNNTGAVAGMFLFRGDREAFRNVPFHPVFDPFVGILFVVGLGLLLAALLWPRSNTEDRRRGLLIAVSLVVLIVPSILSDAPPNFTRTLPAVPLLMMLPSWAASTIWDHVRSSWARTGVALALTGLVTASAVSAYDSYFVRFASSSELYYAFDVRMIDAAQWVNRNTATSQIYLAPLWYQNGTVSLLTRLSQLKSFESRDTVVVPTGETGKDALYAFPVEQEKKAAKLAERLGPLAAQEQVKGSTGEQILVAYRVRAADLPKGPDPLAALARGGEFLTPQKIERAVWSDQFELLGYSIDAADAPKRNLEVTLFLHAIKPISGAYSFSVKVQDGRDRVWGQDDKWTGDNSYATPQWSPGDVIVEKFYPGLSACAPAGEYRITVQAYDPATSQQLALTDREGSTVRLTTVRASASQGNRYEDLEPQQSLDLEVAPAARLMGYTLMPGNMRAGDSFSLSLFWRGQPAALEAPRAIIRLQDARGRDFNLEEARLSLPNDGRGLCTLFDLRTPPETAAGIATVFVNEKQVTTISVER